MNIDHLGSKKCSDDPKNPSTSFICECHLDSTGPLCQTPIDECQPSPCQNGGTCIERADILEMVFSCQCPECFGAENFYKYFYGKTDPADYQQKNFDKNLFFFFHKGFTQIPYAKAPEDFENGWTDSATQRFMQYRERKGSDGYVFIGETCKVNNANIAACVEDRKWDMANKDFGPLPSGEKKCSTDRGGRCAPDAANCSYKCDCSGIQGSWGRDPGVPYDNCLLDMTTCANAPCKNGGICSNNGGKIVCKCASGFHGNRCELTIGNSCASNPCSVNEVCSQTDFPAPGDYACLRNSNSGPATRRRSTFYTTTNIR